MCGGGGHLLRGGLGWMGAIGGWGRCVCDLTWVEGPPALLMTTSMCLSPGHLSLRLLAHAVMLLGFDTSSVVMCSLRLPWELAGCCCCNSWSSAAMPGLRTAATTVLSFASNCLTNSRPIPCTQSSNTGAGKARYYSEKAVIVTLQLYAV